MLPSIYGKFSDRRLSQVHQLPASLVITDIICRPLYRQINPMSGSLFGLFDKSKNILKLLTFKFESKWKISLIRNAKVEMCNYHSLIRARLF